MPVTDNVKQERNNRIIVFSMQSHKMIQEPSFDSKGLREGLMSENHQTCSNGLHIIGLEGTFQTLHYMFEVWRPTVPRVTPVFYGLYVNAFSSLQCTFCQE